MRRAGGSGSDSGPALVRPAPGCAPPVRQVYGAVVRGLRHRCLCLRHADSLPYRPRPRRPAGRDSGVLRRGAATYVFENCTEKRKG